MTLFLYYLCSELIHSVFFRIPLAFGGYAVNSFDDLTEECLGKAGLFYEHVLGKSDDLEPSRGFHNQVKITRIICRMCSKLMVKIYQNGALYFSVFVTTFKQVLNW